VQSGVGKLSCNKTALKRCTSTETLWNRKAPSLSSPEDEEIFLPKLPKSWQADVFKGPKVSTAIGAVVLLLLLFIITCSVVCLCVCWCTMPKRMNRSRCRSIGGCALMGPRNHGGHDLPKGRGTLGVVFGHAQISPQSIVSTLFVRRQQRCSRWLKSL